MFKGEPTNEILSSTKFKKKEERERHYFSDFGIPLRAHLLSVLRIKMKKKMLKRTSTKCMQVPSFYISSNVRKRCNHKAKEKESL